MGAKMRTKSGRQVLRNLRTRLDRLREKADGVEVVAGFVRGKSSPESVYKAYVNEFGSMTTGALSTDKGSSIPSRPFMQQSLKQMKQNVSAIMKDATVRNLDDKLEFAGEVMALAIEDSINSGDFVENAPYTLARKQGSQPLVDTGAMINDITSEVRRTA